LLFVVGIKISNQLIRTYKVNNFCDLTCECVLLFVSLISGGREIAVWGNTHRWDQPRPRLS